jgi:hypothetical protein
LASAVEISINLPVPACAIAFGWTNRDSVELPSATGVKVPPCFNSRVSRSESRLQTRQHSGYRVPRRSGANDEQLFADALDFAGALVDPSRDHATVGHVLADERCGRERADFAGLAGRSDRPATVTCGAPARRLSPAGTRSVSSRHPCAR